MVRRYFDGMGNDVTTYVVSLEAKVTALSEEVKKNSEVFVTVSAPSETVSKEVRKKKA